MLLLSLLRHPPEPLPRADDALLQALGTVHVATAAQLASLEGDQPGRTTRKRLSRLESYGLVRRFINTARDHKIGPAGYIFVLTGRGARLAGRPEALGLRQRKIWHPSQAFIDHWLAITDLYVRLVASARAGDLRLREFRAEGDAKRSYRDSYGRLQILRPDACVRLATGDMLLSWFVEIDRATESPRRIAAKCHAYRAYELSRQEQRHHPVFPGVLFIVPDEARARVIRRVIAGQPSDARGLFWVATKAEAIKALTHPNLT